MGNRTPQIALRAKDVLEWALAEEQHIRMSWFDMKAPDDVKTWVLLLEWFNSYDEQDTRSNQKTDLKNTDN
ncbi:hypothetical protein NDU88_006785 [Pleurodeles waltl]|uniref:Uncharacterized protein n=1 Tax=Pleurodeles waltl TaxID=8319 RepID=A0AAV7TYL2_PLEWA|nr:hypothetical protein NDU88_006785 [Pleurodeles waltl]